MIETFHWDSPAGALQGKEKEEWEKAWAEHCASFVSAGYVSNVPVPTMGESQRTYDRIVADFSRSISKD